MESLMQSPNGRRLQYKNYQIAIEHINNLGDNIRCLGYQLDHENNTISILIQNNDNRNSYVIEITNLEDYSIAIIIEQLSKLATLNNQIMADYTNFDITSNNNFNNPEHYNGIYEDFYSFYEREFNEEKFRPYCIPIENSYVSRTILSDNNELILCIASYRTIRYVLIKNIKPEDIAAINDFIGKYSVSSFAELKTYRNNLINKQLSQESGMLKTRKKQ